MNNCFLMSWLCDWICRPGMEVRQCLNEDSNRLQCKECNRNTKIMLIQCVLQRGHKTFVQGFTICCETRDGTENSHGLDCSNSAEAKCHYGCGFRLRYCDSNGTTTLNGVGRQAGRTGLNLHFILIILFSTNKLKPEKT